MIIIEISEGAVYLLVHVGQARLAYRQDMFRIINYSMKFKPITVDDP